MKGTAHNAHRQIETGVDRFTRFPFSTTPQPLYSISAESNSIHLGDAPSFYSTSGTAKFLEKTAGNDRRHECPERR